MNFRIFVVAVPFAIAIIPPAIRAAEAAQIKALPEGRAVPDARYGNYLPRLLEDLRQRFR